MLNQALDYTRCVINNKYLLTGYVGGVLSLLGIPIIEQEMNIQIPDEVQGFLILTSAALLGITKLGSETYSTYQRASRQIERFGILDKNFARKLTFTYCNNIGLEMATKKHGLEHVLSKESY